MNNKKFSLITKGTYGRKVAYTEYENINPQNIVDVVGKCIGVFNSNKAAAKYLWDYYKGDQPIKYRVKNVRDDITNKICENHAYEIVQFKTGQTYGEPIQCVGRSDDEALTQKVDALNQYMKDAHKQVRDIKCGEWQSAVGTGFKAIQIRMNDDIPFRITVPTPLNTFVIYSRYTEEPVVAVQELQTVEGKSYKLCYTQNCSCKIIDGKVEDWKPHIFGGIPIIEYPNNAERLSDIELVIDLLDAIGNIQSNRIDSIEQFVQSWIKFVNCEVDEKSFLQMKQQGALVVKSNSADNKADVDIMSQELKQTETQVVKDDLWDNVLTILAIPNKQSNTGGDSQGAVELRNGWDFSKTRAKLKDPLVIESEKRLTSIILNIIKNLKNNCDLSVRDFDVVINHSPTDNLIVKCQALQYLLQCGVHPLIALETVGLWGDIEKVFKDSKPYLDVLWKTIDDVQSEQDKANTALNTFQSQNSGGNE